jgi:DNA repair exonuclease SbcCD ATPase subunit
MAYNIVKHRRGTTQEWEKFDLVLEAGELAIEECTGNICRCKIGDGEHAFSSLKYIDEYTIKKLTQEINKVSEIFDNSLSELAKSAETDNTSLTQKIDELRNYFNNRIAELVDSNESNNIQIDTLEQKLTQKIASESELLANQYKAADSEVFAQIDQSIDDKIDNLEAEVDKSISAVVNNVATFKSDCVQMVGETYKKLNTKINDYKDELTAALNTNILNTSILNTNILTIESKFAQSLQEEQTRVTGQIENIDKSISSLSTIQEAIKATVDEHNTVINDISEVTAQNTETTAGLAASIENESEKLSNLTNKLDDEISRLDHNIDSVKEALTLDYENRIVIAETTLQGIIDDLKAEHISNITDVKTLIQDNSDANNTQFKTINDNLSKLEDDTVKTFSRIEQQSATKVELSELEATLKNIQTIVNNLSSNNTDTVNRVFSLQNTLEDVKDNLSKELSNLEKFCNAADLLLDKKITELEKTQQATSLNFYNTLHDYITNIYVEIYDLIDDDIAIINKVFHLQNTLLDKISNIEEEAVEVNKQAIENLNTRMSENSANINEQLNTIRGYYENLEVYLENRLANIESDIGKIKDATIDMGLRGDLDALAGRVDILANDAVTIDERLKKLYNTIEDEDTGLAVTEDKANAALLLAGINSGELSNIKNNYINISEGNVCVGEDIIIFSCGKAADAISVE